MEVRYQRDITNNYLIVELEIDSFQQDYQIPMLINNNIKGLLKLTVGTVDNKIELYYDISSKQRLSVVLERQSLTYEKVKKVLHSIIETMEDITEYLLDGNAVVIESEYIYINPHTYQLFFCYNPFYKGNSLKNLQELFSRLIEKVNYEDKEAVELIYRVYQCSQREEFQIENLENIVRNKTSQKDMKKEKIKEKEEADYISILEPQVPLQQMDVEKEVIVYSFYGKIVISFILILALAIGIGGSFYIIKAEAMSMVLAAKIIVFLLAEVGVVFLSIMKVLKNCKESKIIIEKEVLSYGEEEEEYFSSSTEPDIETEEENYGDTMLLAYLDKKEKRKLLPIHNQEMSEISITHFPYVIGRIKGQADEIINHPLVSRIHLCIEEENEKYYVVDLNSTNGVRVNGMLLEANEKRELFIGDEVEIASISYVFQ